MENLNKEEIMEYWDKLIGEKSKEEVYEMVEYVYGKTIDCLAEEYNKEYDEYNNKILKLLKGNREKFDYKIIEHNKIGRWGSIGNVIINKYSDEINEIYQYKDILSDVEQVIEMLVNKISGEIFTIIYKAVILDIKYYKHNNLLKGDTPEERAQYFNDVIVNSDEYLYEFFEGYPEAVKDMELIAKFSINALKELLENTYKELDKINDIFFKDDNVKCIAKISMDKGDTHNEGRTVAIIEFDNGERIVYKPRRLEIEVAYNKYIEWLDTNLNDDKRLKMTKVYYNDKVGWMEFVNNNSCNDEDDVKEYYYKVGKLMAVLYTFNSNDMHSGNIIAVGNSPVLIDLETILHPNSKKKEIKSAIDVAIQKYSGSVERSALLPSYIVNPRTKEKIDVGGLSNSEEQESPFESDAIVNFDSDEIKISKKKGKMGTEKNIPVKDGNKVTVDKYISYIEKGFRNTYLWIESNKTNYLEKVKELFASLPNRVLLRGTNEYSKMLNLSYHPDLLVNRLDRAMYLIRALVGVRVSSKEAVKCELEQMLNTDIPYFYSFSDSRDLYYNNKLISKDYYDETSLEIIYNKVNEMSEIDMNRQISMMYNKFDMEYPYKSNKVIIKKQDNEYEEETLKRIINIIDKKAIRCAGVDGATWFSKAKDEYDSTMTINLAGEFYNGLTGIYFVLNAYDKKRFNSDIDSLVNDYKKICVKDNTNLKIIKDVTILHNIDLLSLSEIEDYAEILNNNIKDLIENKEYKELNSLYAILMTAYKKLDDQDENITTEIQKSLKLITSSLIEYMENVEKKIEDYKFIDGYYSVLYQLVRYSKNFEDIDVDKLVEDFLTFERNNNIYTTKEDFVKYGYDYIQMMYGKALLYGKSVEDAYLYEEIMSGIENIKNICIEHNYELFGGDAGNIVMLYQISNIIDNSELRDIVNNYKNTFINEFVVKELEKDGHFDVYESFVIDKGITGIAYALMSTSDDYKVMNVFTLE